MQLHQHPEGFGVACARRVAGVCQSARKVPDKVESAGYFFTFGPLCTFTFHFYALCELCADLEMILGSDKDYAQIPQMLNELC